MHATMNLSTTPVTARPVWDRFVRVFHWTLVASFAIAYFSTEHIGLLHKGAGYLTLALIGEKGPEAVVPLGRGGGMGNVTVNVTGGLSTSAEIGQAVVNAIRAYNRSAGPAQIQVA